MESTTSTLSQYIKPSSNQDKPNKETRYFNAINDFSLSLIYIHKEQDVLDYLTMDLSPMLGLANCMVFMYDEKEKVILESSSSYKAVKNKKGIECIDGIPVGVGLVGEVFLNGIAQIKTEELKDGFQCNNLKHRISEIAIPIIYEDKVLGVIYSEHCQEEVYNEYYLLAFTTIASMTATRIINIRDKEKLKSYQQKLETEIQNKTKKLEETIQSLNRSNQELESFAYAISHDLKEPLRTIRGFLDIIKIREDNLSEESKEFMEYVMDGSVRMNQMMDGLLKYARLDYDENGFKEINTNDLILVVQSGLRGAIEESSALITIDELPNIHGNKTQMIQVFQNLIANAIKFTKKGELARIHISGMDLENHTEIYIVDNGEGIPVLMQKHIFKLFYKGDRKIKSGSGVGLALCKKILDCHEGNISVESEVGVGTRFTIQLPKASPFI